MKYRIAIEIPGVPVNETARWQPLAAHLEAFRGVLGPVVVWRDKHVLAVIVATDADTPVDAVTTAVLATTESPETPTGSAQEVGHGWIRGAARQPVKRPRSRRAVPRCEGYPDYH
jgi:hypothetical protein